MTHTVNIWSFRSGAAGIRLIHKCMEMDAYGQVTLISSVCPCKSVFCITYKWVTYTIRYVIVLHILLFDFPDPLHGTEPYTLSISTPVLGKPKIWASTQKPKYAKIFPVFRRVRNIAKIDYKFGHVCPSVCASA